MINSAIGMNTTSPFLTYSQRLRNAAQPSTFTFREQEILNKIRNVVGSEVVVAELEQIGDGFRGGFIGFSGASATGEREPFRITPQILAEMAENEDKLQEWLSNFQRQATQQTDLEHWLAENKRTAEEEEAERKAHQLRVRMMIKTDFWNNADERPQSAMQGIHEKVFETQRAALGYEEMAVFR
ncbi:MAG: hypothetical protein FWG68_00100 [Defluviitaleaceae bacterium]|nr:hypothetical protein [Defluviitaleaceae bacterium]